MTNLLEEEQDREQCRLEEDTTEEILGAGGLGQGAQGRDRIDPQKHSQYPRKTTKRKEADHQDQDDQQGRELNLM